ncbi:uncharacterized protein PG986_014333 [Apiospora aurea]|uniref:Uncharacterized protein n=1 Tax=Apiospora aurea TaxID=335848 RepID=A0ABR1PT73_9PEZI
MRLTAATVENESWPGPAPSTTLTDDVQRVIATLPLDLKDLASTVGNVTSHGGKSRSELAPDVTNTLRQGISDLTDMVRYNHSAKEALDTLQHLYVLWTDGGALSEAQQQQAQSLFPFSFHVQGQLRVASGLSLQEAGFTMF